MSQESTFVHLAAGGTGGTAGAVITCPLEVIKTRLQSSLSSAEFQGKPRDGVASASSGHKPVDSLKGQSARYLKPRYTNVIYNTRAAQLANSVPQCKWYSGSRSVTGVTAAAEPMPTTLWKCFKHIVRHEGYRGLFKGLGPNLVGVAPSRSAYFWAYSSAKRFWNSVLTPDTPLIHILSASFAGFFASTLTNPIWFVKTRLQLDQKARGSITVSQCVRQVYREKGIRGFYRGITASYYGISETVIHFVIYEAIKAKLHEWKVDNPAVDASHKSYSDFLKFMAASACSKSIATCCAYPHEVARTRLREEGSRYRTFWGTLGTVLREEGLRGTYRGLSTQLVRQIPNTAIMMATYELVVYLASSSLEPCDHSDSATDALR